MSRTEVFETVVKICKDIFGNDKVELTDASTADDVQEWDSLTHLSIINEIEAEYDVEFTLDEVRGSKNLGELIDALMRHIEKKADGLN